MRPLVAVWPKAAGSLRRIVDGTGVAVCLAFLLGIAVHRWRMSTAAYQWVRHPSYPAAMAMLLGIGLALGSWGSVLVIALAAALVYGYRIRVEERALLATLGAPNAEYMRRTRRLVPFVL